jgi:hypothetical protein
VQKVVSKLERKKTKKKTTMDETFAKIPKVCLYLSREIKPIPWIAKDKDCFLSQEHNCGTGLGVGGIPSSKTTAREGVSRTCPQLQGSLETSTPGVPSPSKNNPSPSSPLTIP